MAESIPTFRKRNGRTSLTHALAAAALAAGISPMGCFRSNTEENPYSVFVGERIEKVEMAMEPDGSILLLAQVGMYYAPEDNPGDYRMRNLHTVLYRRSNGKWMATPFENLQDGQSTFPSFIQDQEGRNHALIWDGGGAKAYFLQGDRWRPQMAIPRAWRFEDNFMSRDLNWNLHPYIGFKDDSTLYLVVRDDKGKHRLEESRGSWSIPLGTDFSPHSFLSGPGYDALVGREYVERQEGEELKPEFNSVYYFWRRGQAEIVRVDLGLPDWPQEAFFAPYKGGTGLFFRLRESIHLFPLDADGRPQTAVTAPAAILGNMSENIRTAADTGGCFQSLSQMFNLDSMKVPRLVQKSAGQERKAFFVSWNSCRSTPDTSASTLDTLTYVRSAEDSLLQIFNFRFRIRPDGTRVFAFLEADPRRYIGPFSSESSLSRTRLVIAEEKQGTWTTEVVDSR